MTRINNSADLNYYYKTWAKPETEAKVDKKNKTRLIILTDKESGKEYLDAKKLTLPERIGALFGGKASFSRVVEFCNQKNMHSKGLAKLVEHYNESHTTKPIKYSYLVPGTSRNEKTLVSVFEPKQGPIEDYRVTLDKYQDEAIINTNIKQAYESGNDDGLVALLERLPLPQKQQILDEACATGKDRMIDLLHKSGMTDFNAKNGPYTPLMIAAEAGHEHVVTTLLHLGADPKISVPPLGDPLLLAAKNGNFQVVKLLTRELKEKFTPERLIKLLEDPNVNDNVKEGLVGLGAKKVNNDGKNALMLAIDAGKFDIAKMLQYSSDWGTQDSDGNNPLLLACKKPPSEARDKLIATLLKYEPSEIFRKNKSGVDAISYANQNNPRLLAEFEKYAKSNTNPEAQKILARLADDAKKAEESAQRVEAAKQADRQAEISKNLDTIKTEAGQQKLKEIDSLPTLTQDTALLVAYRALDTTALEGLARTYRGLLLVDLSRTKAGTTEEDRILLINKDLGTAARLPLVWLNAQLDKLPTLGLSADDKAAKNEFETKGKNLMASYAPVIDANTYAALLKDYPEFKP